MSACPNDRFPGRRLDFEVEHGGEADRAQEPQPIFGETLRRVANRPHEPGAEVLAAADEINHGVVRRIEEHAVNREIAAARVFFRGREVHFCRVPAVEISAVGPESRDLELQVILQNDDDAEMRANRVGAAEKSSAPRPGARRSRYRYPSEPAAHEIAHASACEVGGVAGCAQSIYERTSGRKRRELFLVPAGFTHSRSLVRLVETFRSWSVGFRVTDQLSIPLEVEILVAPAVFVVR